MIDERFATAVTAWLRRTDAAPRHGTANVAQAMAEIHRTRQRRRWLWFLPRPKPTAGAADRRDRASVPAPISTTYIGGTRTMISPTKTVATAAVAALVGTLLLAGPYTSQDPGPPVADSQELGQISTTQGQGHLTATDDGVRTPIEQGYLLTDGGFTLEIDMDDPRLSGTMLGVMNTYSFGTGGPTAWTGSLQNEGGSWTVEGRGYSAPPSGGWHMQQVLTGHGDYDGLSAILAGDQDQISPFFDLRGAVFTGDLPPLPE